MTMREIPRSEWRSFFERFSREHRGWLGTMHWVPAAGAPMTAQAVSLESISFQKQPSGDLVRLGCFDGPSIRVGRPQAVRIKQSDRSAERALEIDTAAGLFRLAFRATALHELLDGLAPNAVRTGSGVPHIAEENPPAA